MDFYDQTKHNLFKFLKDALGKDITITIYQFDFLIIYFPVYLIVKEMEESGIKIKFKQIPSDQEIWDKMKNTDSLKIDSGNLNLALCEPTVFNKIKESENIMPYELKHYNNKYGDSSKYLQHARLMNDEECGYFIHLPFINFPPLYGVALENNPSINKIKRNQSEEERGKNVSIVDYWKHFSAKLSLLDKNNFVELAISSYPKGSTTDGFIRSKYQFKQIAWVKSIEKEFDDLFHRMVDVAFTIQPWEAVIRSEIEAQPVDIEIVYKGPCTKYDSTSLIFHTFNKENLLIGEFVLNCMSVLLQNKIEKLYGMEPPELEEIIKDYCELLVKNDGCGQSCKNKDNITCNEKIDMKEGCLFETKMALRLTNDSQIYQHLHDIKDERISIENVVPDYFVEKFGNSQDGIEAFLTLEASYLPHPSLLRSKVEKHKEKITITEMDKRLFKIYRTATIGGMKKSGGFNLSKELSALIGPFKDFNPNMPNENFLHGLLFSIAHGHNYKQDQKKQALNRLYDLLRLDPIITDDIGDPTFENYNYKDDLIISANNICCIFKEAIKSLPINIVNQLVDSEDTSRLYLPPIIFQQGKRFFKPLFKEIIKNHYPKSKSKLDVIVRGQSHGKDNECIYVLELSFHPIKKWDLNPSKVPKFPDSLKIGFHINSKMNLYCDYLINVIDNNIIYITDLDTQKKDTFLVAEKKTEITVRGKKMPLSKLSSSTQCMDDSISHILVFDNRQKLMGGSGSPNVDERNAD